MQYYKTIAIPPHVIQKMNGVNSYIEHAKLMLKDSKNQIDNELWVDMAYVDLDCATNYLDAFYASV